MIKRHFAYLFLWPFLALASDLRGQTFTGTVVGHVLDQQREWIPGVSLTLRSVERGFTRTTQSNAHGEYFFQLVPPGMFTVKAEASGFAVATVNVEVVVATPVRADLTLNVQSLKQSIKVLGENGVSVQTENAGLGRTINPVQMSEFPSLARSPYDFMAIMPGATPSNDGLGVGYALNGGRTQSANYLLDGGENNDAFMSAPAMDVPLDSIEEFSVQTNHFSAEYGRNSSFVANIVTKSGTNNLHGSLYDYLRNSALAANTFDNNAHQLPRPEFSRNQFGGTLGGPIRRRKLFFFASIEPILVRSSGPNQFYVPTPQLLAISAPGTQSIFERYPVPSDLSPTDVLQRKVCPFGLDCSSGGGYITLPAFALSTRSGPQDAGAGFPQNTILATGRTDWQVNNQTLMFLRYAFESKNLFAYVSQPYTTKLDVPDSGHNQNVAINLIRTWTPHLATESRFVYSRVTGDPDRFGGGNPLVPNPPIPLFYILDEPSVTLPAGTEKFGGPTNTYQLFQTVTWARGRHTLKFGGQYIQLRDNRTYGVGEVADARFSTMQDFVNGVLNLYTIALNPQGHFPGQSMEPPFGPPSFTRHFRYNEPSVFIEDIWKIAPRMTLTAGLRWEYFDVLHSPGAEHPIDSNFYSPSAGSALEQTAKGQFLRTIDAPGDFRGHFYLPSYKNFAPRLGAAYDLFGDGKTVIRAGAGLFYDRRVGWELFRAALNPPSYSLTQLTDVPVNAALLDNQYVAFPNSPILLDQSDTKPIDTHLRPAYTVSWNLTFEHEFVGSLVAGASYLGSNGSRLYSLNDLSRQGSGGLLDPSCLTTRYAADGTTPLGPDYTNCPGLNSEVSSLVMRGNAGHSSFEALQLRVDSRRISRLGIQFGVNYTLSHSIDDSSISGTSLAIANVGSGFLDAFDPSLDRGPSDFDQRHRFAAYWIWEIPLGQNSHSWRRRYILSGWEVSGILSYQTGQPFTIGDLGVPDFTTERTRPRLTGAIPKAGPLLPDAASHNQFLYLPINQVYDQGTGACIANTAPFACELSVNGPFYGILPRNAFRQPGTYFQNIALIKNFPLPKEGMQLQFRAEFYNLCNHSNLYINAGTADVSSLSFTPFPGTQVSGVTASFKDNRQIVLALRLIF
jgi:Carboxypeptidase regulatory-like domain/TonB dependent receptor-like, beta-barrel